MRGGKGVAHTKKRDINKAFLVGKREGRRTLERPRRRWKNNNIKIDLPEILSEGLTVIDMAEDRHKWLALLKTVINLLVP
jgi:hypothetical protein